MDARLKEMFPKLNPHSTALLKSIVTSPPLINSKNSIITKKNDDFQTGEA